MSGWPPSRRDRGLGLATFVVCLVGLLVLAWLVSQPGIPSIDTAATSFLHGLASPTMDGLMTSLTDLGSSVVLAGVTGLAVVLLAVRRRPAEALFIVVALVGTLLLNDALKLLVQRPRPGFEWAGVWPESSFPSGHAMSSLVVYVAVALVIARTAGRRSGRVDLAVAFVLVLGIGMSRIYLGAHWLTDVLGGYLAGALWLLVLAAAAAAVAWLRRRRQAARGPEGERLPRLSRPVR